MKYKLSQYRKKFYAPCSRPSLPTLRKKIREGRLKGGVIEDGHYWVDTGSSAVTAQRAINTLPPELRELF